MNDRIVELANLAGCSIDGMGFGEGNVEGLIKLVVKDCVDAVSNIEEMYFNAICSACDVDEKNRYAEGQTACQMVKRKLEAHLGVE